MRLKWLNTDVFKVVAYGLLDAGLVESVDVEKSNLVATVKGKVFEITYSKFKRIVSKKAKELEIPIQGEEQIKLLWAIAFNNVEDGEIVYYKSDKVVIREPVKKVTLSVRITEELSEKIVKLAEKMGKTKTDIVVEALEKYLKEHLQP